MIGREFMGYRIGLDVGIASTGYSVLKTDRWGDPYKIIIMNSVIFPQAENPKTGASLAKPRRLKRGTRRRTRRKNFRKKRTRNLFVKKGLLTYKEINEILTSTPKGSVYELRVAGLDRRLSNRELFRILYFFAGHRGFKSNRKSELNPSDPADRKKMGLLLNSIEAIRQELKEKNYRTVGELYLRDPKYSEHKRNKGYKDGYLSTPSRQMLINEIKLILKKQRELGNEQIDDDFQRAYLGDKQYQRAIFTGQRNFDEGPGAGPYAGDQIAKMVGKDIFEPNEDRAAKATYTFQYFNLLQKVNSLQYQETAEIDLHPLDSLQRQEVVKAVFAKAEKPTKTYKSTNFAELRKLLDLSVDGRFNLVNYGSAHTQKEINKIEKKTRFINLKPYHDLTNVLPEELWSNHQLIDFIGEALTLYSSDSRRRRYFDEELNLPQDLIKNLLALNFSNFGHLSLKSMHKIIPYLEMGQVYSEAMTSAGYHFREKEISQKTIQKEVTNPVVRRAVSKTIKVVEQIIRRYGKPDAINIELARELGHSHADRKEILKRQESNRDSNQRIADKIKELDFPVPINGQNIIRYKLFREQNEFDPYTGDKIPITQLFSANYEVDHIIPYSISWDDRYTNKVLTSRKCNREKGDRLPLTYLANDEHRVAVLKNMANATIHNTHKRQNLLKKKMSDDEKNNWKQRNINDTRYISRLLYNYFEQTVEFNPDLKQKKRVYPLNGEVTAKIRNRWGLAKVRENGDLHHAVDAVVIACITPQFVHQVTVYSRKKEIRENKVLWSQSKIEEVEAAAKVDKMNSNRYKKVFNDFPLPWPDFRKELHGRMAEDPVKAMSGDNKSWDAYTPQEIRQLKPIFVVRIANHKITGPAHLDTIRSARLYQEKGIVLTRVKIDQLKLNDKGEVTTGDGIYSPENSNFGDQVVYQAIKEALLENKKSGEKAFPDGYLEYVDHGTKKIVRKVRVAKKASLPVPLKNKAVADNDLMVRIDVFYTGKKFVFVPVYVKDTVEKKLPDRAATQRKAYKDWYRVSEKDKFCFSLYQNDVVHIVPKKEITPKYLNNEIKHDDQPITEFFGYFNGANIATASISVRAHDNSYTSGSVGIATLLKFEKYQVDYFGRYYKVHEKKRQSFVRRDI